MIVYVDPTITGNLYIRAAPNTGAPSVGIPAYNYKNVGILYAVDDISRDEKTGDIWYRLRGLGWSMAKFLVIYSPESEPEEDNTKRWLVGLSADEVRECIEYLRTALEGEENGVD